MTKCAVHHHPHHKPHLSIAHGFTAFKKSKYAMVLLVLVGVLVFNMLLLVPQLHAPDTTRSNRHGWHLVEFTGSATTAAAAAAATLDTLTTAASQSNVEQQQQSTQQVRVQQQQQSVHQQMVKRRSRSSVAAGEFVASFDANEDGVLGPPEFHSLVQEACRNERSSMTLFKNLRRLIRLAIGLNPTAATATGQHPCSFTGELWDMSRQAVRFVLGGGSASGSEGIEAGTKGPLGARRATHRGSSAAVTAAGGGAGIRAATGAAGAATVDPDSPEGQAAARSAALLSGCSRLTPELAAAAASHNTLLLAAADWAMFELFGVNWLAHVQRSGLDNYLIAALDQRTASFLRTSKLGHCVLWSSEGAAGDGPLPKVAAPYAAGSKAHKVASWSKLEMAYVLLSWGYDVVLSDLDTVWLTDPVPYLSSHVPEAADLVIATDAPANNSIMASADSGLLLWPYASSPVNPAVAYIKGTEAGQAAVSAWLATNHHQQQQLSRDDASAKQLQFPDAVVQAWLQQPWVEPHPDDPSRLLLLPGRGGGLFGGVGRRRRRAAAVGLFSPVAAANSYSWFVQDVGTRAAAILARSSSSAAPGRKLPLAVHLGSLGGDGGREARLHQMREARWYADGPRYYSEPKLLSFDLVPYSHTAITASLANLPTASPSDLLTLHLASINYQLQQLYAAAAAAVALGRTLLLPQLQCYCYRDPTGGAAAAAAAPARKGSNGHDWSCRAPGDNASVFPFNCTLDQVLSPQVLYQHGAVFGGKALTFREAPFLHNVRTPSWLRHAKTAVSSGTPAGCEHSSSGGGASGKCAQVLPGRPPDGVNQQVVVPAGLTDVELVQVLEPLATAKCLHFSDITTVFGGFGNPTHKVEYERWLDRVVLPWCCKPGTAAAALAADSSVSSALAAADAAASSAGITGDATVMDSNLPEAAAAVANQQRPTALAELPAKVPGWVLVPVQARLTRPVASQSLQ